MKDVSFHIQGDLANLEVRYFQLIFLLISKILFIMAIIHLNIYYFMDEGWEYFL